MNKFTFHEGEIRELTAVVTSRKTKETVVIASAEYELKNTFDNTVVQKGSCDIEGNEAIVLLDLNKKGDFELEVTSSVGREKIIRTTNIEVV